MASISQEDKFSKTFAQEVHKGLIAPAKWLPSKYFYDDKGSRLFQQIMHMPEYYPTNSEFEIFSEQGAKFSKHIFDTNKPVEIVELGAGDGLKTKVLLKYFLSEGKDFTYKPVDISAEALKMLKERLNTEIPELDIAPMHADYFAALEALQGNDTRKVILFLGSNIGNFRQRNGAAQKFLDAVSASLDKDDLLILGADLRKDPNVILKAYNDPHGITKAFNLNLLHRMNRELNANFDLESFVHYPFYDIESGEARSYIVSTKAQTVEIGATDSKYQFEAWEYIHVEISQKYTFGDLEKLADKAQFSVSEFLLDCKHFFTDAVLKKDI